MMSRFLIGALCIAAGLTGCARDSRQDGADPLSPVSTTELAAMGTDCARTSTQYMSTTTDLGASFVDFPTARQATLSLTWGLAALDDAGTLVMQADDELWVSENDGCSWAKVRGIPTRPKAGTKNYSAEDTSDPTAAPLPAADGIFRVVAGDANLAYAWQDNGGRLIRVQRPDTPGARWESVEFRAPTANMHGFGVDANDAFHVRTAGNDGQIFESFDGGASWHARGIPASRSNFLGYVVAFDPNDLDHVVYGRVTDGGFVTFDGGRSWTQSTGLTSTLGGSVNLFNAVISPVDGNTVFAMAIDLAETSAGAPSNGRHIYASTDGGASFAPVLDHLSEGVLLSNGPVMLADPLVAGRLLFLSSSKPVFGGTTFYEYDLDSDSMKSVHNDTIPPIRVLAHSRVNPGALHAGFDWF